MAEPRLMKMDSLKVDQIIVRDRVRPVDEARVQSLLASIDELGALINPLTIRKTKAGEYVLMAGGHRLEAAKRLEWDVVPVRVWTDVTNDWSMLVELDENLAGGLTPLDAAVFLAGRKAVYLRKHPETAKGVAGGSAYRPTTDTMSVVPDDDQTDTMSVWSFAAVAALSMGVTERHVRRLIRAGEHLTTDEVDWLRLAPEPVKVNDLVTLSKIPDDRERGDVVVALASGKVKTAAQAVKQRAETRNNAPEPRKEDVLLSRLQDAWANAPKSVRRQFVEAEFRALNPLILELGADE